MLSSSGRIRLLVQRASTVVPVLSNTTPTGGPVGGHEGASASPATNDDQTTSYTPQSKEKSDSWLAEGWCVANEAPLAGGGEVGAVATAHPTLVAPLVRSSIDIAPNPNSDLVPLLSAVSALQEGTPGTWMRLKDLAMSSVEKLQPLTATNVLCILAGERILGTLESRRLQDRLAADLPTLPFESVMRLVQCLLDINATLTPSVENAIREMLPNMIERCRGGDESIILGRALVCYFNGRVSLFDALAQHVVSDKVISVPPRKSSPNDRDSVVGDGKESSDSHLAGVEEGHYEKSRAKFTRGSKVHFLHLLSRFSGTPSTAINRVFRRWLIPSPEVASMLRGGSTESAGSAEGSSGETNGGRSPLHQPVSVVTKASLTSDALWLSAGHKPTAASSDGRWRNDGRHHAAQRYSLSPRNTTLLLVAIATQLSKVGALAGLASSARSYFRAQERVQNKSNAETDKEPESYVRARVSRKFLQHGGLMDSRTVHELADHLDILCGKLLVEGFDRRMLASPILARRLLDIVTKAGLVFFSLPAFDLAMCCMYFLLVGTHLPPILSSPQSPDAGSTPSTSGKMHRRQDSPFRWDLTIYEVQQDVPPENMSSLLDALYRMGQLLPTQAAKWFTNIIQKKMLATVSMCPLDLLPRLITAAFTTDVLKDDSVSAILDRATSPQVLADIAQPCLSLLAASPHCSPQLAARFTSLMSTAATPSAALVAHIHFLARLGVSDGGRYAPLVAALSKKKGSEAPTPLQCCCILNSLAKAQHYCYTASTSSAAAASMVGNKMLSNHRTAAGHSCCGVTGVSVLLQPNATHQLLHTAGTHRVLELMTTGAAIVKRDPLAAVSLLRSAAALGIPYAACSNAVDHIVDEVASRPTLALVVALLNALRLMGAPKPREPRLFFVLRKEGGEGGEGESGFSALLLEQRVQLLATLLYYGDDHPLTFTELVDSLFPSSSSTVPTIVASLEKDTTSADEEALPIAAAHVEATESQFSARHVAVLAEAASVYLDGSAKEELVRPLSSILSAFCSNYSHTEGGNSSDDETAERLAKTVAPSALMNLSYAAVRCDVPFIDWKPIAIALLTVLSASPDLLLKSPLPLEQAIWVHGYLHKARFKPAQVGQVGKVVTKGLTKLSSSNVGTTGEVSHALRCATAGLTYGGASSTLDSLMSKCKLKFGIAPPGALVELADVALQMRKRSPHVSELLSKAINRTMVHSLSGYQLVTLIRFFSANAERSQIGVIAADSALHTLWALLELKMDRLEGHHYELLLTEAILPKVATVALELVRCSQAHVASFHWQSVLKALPLYAEYDTVVFDSTWVRLRNLIQQNVDMLGEGDHAVVRKALRNRPALAQSPPAETDGLVAAG